MGEIGCSMLPSEKELFYADTTYLWPKNQRFGDEGASVEMPVAWVVLSMPAPATQSGESKLVLLMRQYLSSVSRAGYFGIKPSIGEVGHVDEFEGRASTRLRGYDQG